MYSVSQLQGHSTPGLLATRGWLVVLDPQQYDTTKRRDVTARLSLSTLQGQTLSVIQRYWSRMNHMQTVRRY
jgi:hypothetical protein